MNAGPMGRAIRTFLAALAGYAVAWAAIDWIRDYRVGLATVAVNLVTAALAALAAGLLAQGGRVTTTPLGKALATFCQMVGAGIAPVVVTSLADLADVGRLIVTTAIGALLAALATFATNQAEASLV